MLKLRANELKEGMVVASDAYVSGVSIPVVRGGVVLSQTYIEKIKKHGVAFIDNPVNVAARQNITMESASFAIIKTDGDLAAGGDIIDTNIVARGEVKIGGKILRGQVQTHSRMVLGGCGSEESGQVMLVVKPLESQELMQELFKIDTAVSGLVEEREGFQNIIDLIKKLGKAIDQLPQDKRLEFAKGVKRFKDIEAEVAALESKKSDIKGEIDRLLSIRRIIVNGDIFPGTIVSIANKSLTITAKSSRLSFCVKGSKIVTE
ncbi:MAG: FapA family protein [Nitrospirae bacterium]|nr:FapA family protein [Nitrospirota bacterium]MCL5978047.1 FapA family protein [Nitrospirota bacterium]